MKVKNVGSNMTELQLGYNTFVLFSYETPVAACWEGVWFKTEEWYSKTTTKHVNKWLEGIKAQTKPQEFFNSLIGEGVRMAGSGSTN
jgi:hypothetical protein